MTMKATMTRTKAIERARAARRLFILGQSSEGSDGGQAGPALAVCPFVCSGMLRGAMGC
jgi:hypothetical protein